jgi:hypothetical protein
MGFRKMDGLLAQGQSVRIDELNKRLALMVGEAVRTLVTPGCIN